MQTSEYTNVIKVLPKYYPLAKTRNSSINNSLSPIRGLKRKIPTDDPISNYNITASVENKKLENLESFFAEKFRKVSNKVKKLAKEGKNDKSQIEKFDKLTTFASITEEPQAYISRVKKDLMKTEEEVQELLDVEEHVKNSKEKPFAIEYKKKESDRGKHYLSKFAVLSKKATQILKKVESQGKIDLERVSINAGGIKFPVLKQTKFFDPTPLPPNFTVSKDLIIPRY